MIVEQLRLDDVSEEYKAFVEKFKPKKTTDDCYTPENVYNAILDWVVDEYGIDRDNIVRPFWPGGNYERHEYPEGCVVVDNPPFSIVSSICSYYIRHGIRFFLFAPYLTNFSSQIQGLCHIICDASIMYENGAEVNTSFLTNLEMDCEIRTAPVLRKMIIDADAVNRKKKVRQLPKYSYPPEVLTATMMGYLSKYGIDYRINRRDCFFVRALNCQRDKGKTIFGSGYLLSEKAAAEKAAAEKWVLSEQELAIVRSLGKGANS